MLVALSISKALDSFFCFMGRNVKFKEKICSSFVSLQVDFNTYNKSRTQVTAHRYTVLLKVDRVETAEKR